MCSTSGYVCSSLSFAYYCYRFTTPVFVSGRGLLFFDTFLYAGHCLTSYDVNLISIWMTDDINGNSEGRHDQIRSRSVKHQNKTLSCLHALEL